MPRDPGLRGGFRRTRRRAIAERRGWPRDKPAREWLRVYRILCGLGDRGLHRLQRPRPLSSELEASDPRSAVAHSRMASGEVMKTKHVLIALIAATLACTVPSGAAFPTTTYTYVDLGPGPNGKDAYGYGES